MKNVIIVLAFLIGSIGISKAQEVQKAKIIVATYSGYSTEGYYFTNDLDKNEMQFAKIEPETLKKYDLNSDIYLNQTFRVTYINAIEAESASIAPDAKNPKEIIDLVLIESTDGE